MGYDKAKVTGRTQKESQGLYNTLTVEGWARDIHVSKKDPRRRDLAILEDLEAIAGYHTTWGDDKPRVLLFTMWVDPLTGDKVLELESHPRGMEAPEEYMTAEEFLDSVLHPNCC